MKKKLITSLVALCALPAQAVTSLTIPNTAFSSGTPISSSAMNNNFSTIQTFINGSVCLNDGTNCAYTGTVSSVTAGTGLVGGPITTSGTLLVDVGTTANKIVQLDGSARLPAVNGSLLTNLNASSISTGSLSFVNGGTGATSQAMAQANLNYWSLVSSDIYYLIGNVGIGTASPVNPLHIFKPTGTGLHLQSSDTGLGKGLAMEFRSSTNKIAQIRPYSDASVGGSLYFDTSADGVSYLTRMAVMKDGKVGIGTVMPQQLIGVSAPGSNPAMIHFTNASTGTTAGDGLHIGYSLSQVDFLNKENTPISFWINNIEVMKIDTNGDVLNLTGAYNTLSDERIKKDFRPMTNVFGKLADIHAYYYKLKKDKDQRVHVGVKAQEVEKSFPELVSTGKDGLKSVSYSQLVAPVIDAVNQLHQRVTALEPSSRTPASEDRMKKLEAENAQLKAWICKKDATAPFCH